MMRAIAIDDEPLALNIIAHFCSNEPFIALEKTFTKQTEAIKYLNKYPVDLIFLDIQMPAKNGISFYKTLETNAMVIFTTAYSEYAVDGFNLNATDYLLKPFSEERFKQAIQKARNEFEFRKNTQAQTHLMLRADYKLYRIEYHEIVMIEALDDYIQIHLTSKNKIVARQSMKSILDKLPENLFLRVHRTYIVPIEKIKSIQNRTITVDEFVIPVGDTYKNQLLRLDL